LVVPPGETLPVRRPDLAQNPKALAARVRAECHRVVALLAKKAHETLAELLGEGTRFTVQFLDETMAPYWAAHPTIDTTPKARQPVLTHLTPDGQRRWLVRHDLLDETGERDWYLEGVIDLSGRDDVEGLLLELRHVGP
jgi:hypothetical protein